MKRLVLLCLAALTVLVLTQGVRADDVAADDPFFTEALANTCPANCALATLANDPLWVNGPKTLEFILNATVPYVTPGDVLVTEFGSPTVGDIIRLEDIAGVGAVAFIYSDDLGGGFAADVGLPPSYQSNQVTISEDKSGNAPPGVTSGHPYTPTGTTLSSQPGFCWTDSTKTATCHGQRITLPNGSSFTLANNIGYALQSSKDVPEPASLLLFGTGLAGLAGAFKMRRPRS